MTVADKATLDARSTNGDGGLLLGPLTRIFETTGAAFTPLGATNVTLLDAVLPPVETTAVVAPAACAGAVAVMLVAVAVTPVAATPPIVTVASLPKPVPAIVIVAPPVVETDEGDTDVIAREVVPPPLLPPGDVPGAPQLMAMAAARAMAANRSGGVGNRSALRRREIGDHAALRRREVGDHAALLGK